MRVRKSLKILPLLFIFLLVTGGVVGALVYHVNDAADAAKKETDAKIEAYFSNRDEKIKNDVQHLTQTEIQRLKDETNQYLDEKLKQDYQSALNQKSNEIKKVTDQKIEEIKQFIDQQLQEQRE
jgi:predicted flavoprotein YhiN